MQDYLFTLADPEFYETLSRYPASPEFENLVRPMVPADWEFGRRSIWLHAAPPDARLPAQGFKVHVTSVLGCAADVLRAVVPVLVARGTAFKLAGQIDLLALLNSKPYDRGGSGKFITAYPADEADFRGLLEALHARTAGMPFVGPYILSDRRYADSKILFYRYGGIKPAEVLAVDGTKHAPLVAPDGTTEPDNRLPYFKLPRWVADPFGGAPELQGDGTAPLGGRYAVTSVLSASNRGGVYAGTDTATGAPVIIKEARPFINGLYKQGGVVDSTDFVRNEHRILTHLEGVGRTPRALDLFTEWEHTFLVQSRVEGTGLRRYLSLHENMMLPYIQRPGVLDRFLPKFRALVEEIVDAVSAVHAADVVLGDVSLNNVMVDPESLRVTLIDLESAAVVSRDGDFLRFSEHWFTPGFARPGRGKGSGPAFTDDWYGVGMLALNLLVPGVEFFYLKPEGRQQFLNHLRGLGLPAWPADVVTELLAGRPEAARAVLRVGSANDPSVSADQAVAPVGAAAVGAAA